MLNILFLTISSTLKKRSFFILASVVFPGNPPTALPPLNPRLQARTSGSSSTWRPPRAWTWVRLRTSSPAVGRVYSFCSAWRLHGISSEKIMKARLAAPLRLFVPTQFLTAIEVTCRSESVLSAVIAEYGCFKTQLLQIWNWESLIVMQENVSSTWWRNVWRRSSVVIFFVLLQGLKSA